MIEKMYVIVIGFSTNLVGIVLGSVFCLPNHIFVTRCLFLINWFFFYYYFLWLIWHANASTSFFFFGSYSALFVKWDGKL